MINVTFIETVYPAPEDDEEDYCPDGALGRIEVEALTFRELVRAMRDYPFVSCSPAIGATYEWLHSESEQDYRTGDYTERSMHYSRDNPENKKRYWRLAMKAAGLLTA